MKKGRYMVWCSCALLAGNFFGGWITLAPAAYLVLAALFSFLSVIYRRTAVLFLALFFAGAFGVQSGRMPIGGDSSNGGRISVVSPIKEKAFEVNHLFSNYLEMVLPEGDELGVVKALTIGDKSDISYELKQGYKKSGAMHLLALSGMHVGVIYALLLFVLSALLGNSRGLRYIKSGVILLFLWGFAFMTGLSNSIFRAVLMISVYEISSLINADRDGPTSLAVSALIITLFNPEAPRDIGFQLSFCAVISIFTIYPLLKRLLNAKSLFLRYIWSLVSLSISCQIGTGVISYLYFGTFPRYFMVTNLVAVPLVQITIYLTTASLALFGLPHIGTLAATLLEKLIHLLNLIIMTLGEM